MSWVALATLLLKVVTFIVKWKYPQFGALLSGVVPDENKFASSVNDLQSVIRFGRSLDELTDSERTEFLGQFVLYRD
jgi:hypothetical protein